MTAPKQLFMPGIAIEVEMEPIETATLGVQVEYHPGIQRYMRVMALESALRHWQRGVGAVTRGAKPQDPTWLPGWRLAIFGEGTVTRLKLAWYDDDRELYEDHEHE